MMCKSPAEDEFTVFSGKVINLLRPVTEDQRDAVAQEARKECYSPNMGSLVSQGLSPWFMRFMVLLIEKWHNSQSYPSKKRNPFSDQHSNGEGIWRTATSESTPSLWPKPQRTKRKRRSNWISASCLSELSHIPLVLPSKSGILTHRRYPQKIQGGNHTF